MDDLNFLLQTIKAEVRAAQRKFPAPNLTHAALAEEVGKLAKACLEEGPTQVMTEAVQVAAMAIRIVLDGDPSFDEHRKKLGFKPLGYKPTNLERHLEK